MEPNAAGDQIIAQRLPQAGVEVRGGDVEDEALAGAEEVDVEHGRQLGGGQPRRLGEEAAGEHLERQMPCGDGEVDVLQEGLGIDVVELVVDVGDRYRRQRRRGAGVDPGQVGHAKGGTAQGEGERVPGRREGQAAERILATLGVDEGIVVDGSEPAQLGVRAAE